MTNAPTPWSKRHKLVTRAAAGGLTYSLSNSFAEPLSSKELIDMTIQRGDTKLVDIYNSHPLTYTPNGGSSDLREEIANLYGPEITAANILVFPGAQIALQCAARVLVDRGEGHSITFSPGYQSVTQGPLHAGGGVTTIPLRSEDEWQIDVSKVKEAMRVDTRYIVINEPYNPAGTLMSPETQAELRSLASSHGAYVLCDEVYRLLEHDPSYRIPAMADFYERGISCVTLSKPWGACGVSIGWLATQDLDLIDKLSDAQYFGAACPSRASEIQAIMVLRSSEQILEKNMAIIRRNRALLVKFVSDYSDLFGWVPPRAGAIAAIKFKGPLTSTELGMELAREGISIKPAYCFTENITEANDYFRVGFGESIVPKAIDALRDFVNERKEGWRANMSETK